MLLRAGRGSATTVTGLGTFNIKDPAYGALGDGLEYTDGSVTSGSKLLSSPSYTFVAGDAGKRITVLGGGAAGANYNSTIASVSAGVATLTANISTTITGTADFIFGTDDSTAILAAVNAAAAAGGGLVVVPTGFYISSTSILVPANIQIEGNGWWLSKFFYSNSTLQSHGFFYNSGFSYGTPCTNIRMEHFEVDLRGSDGTYAVEQKCVSMLYTLNSQFKNLYLHDSPATCIGTDFGLDVTISGCIIANGGRNNNGSVGGGNGIGIGVAGASNPNAIESYTVFDNFVLNCKRYGIFWETQDAGTNNLSNGAKVRCFGNYVTIGATGQYGIGDTGVSDFICTNNHVVGTSGCLEGIVVNPGTLGFSPGIIGLIANNVVKICKRGILIDYTTTSPTVCEYNVSNNICDTNQFEGIRIVASATVVMATLKIDGNYCRKNGAAGIFTTGAGGIKDLVINNNSCMNNAVTTATASQDCGISLGSPTTRLLMTGNKCSDNQGSPTQAYGLIINNVAITGACFNNDFSANVSGPISLISAATFVGPTKNNIGCMVQTLTAAGPYTVSPFDETLLVNQTSGAAITLNFPANGATQSGKEWIVKDAKLDASSNNITLSAGSGNIVGTASAGTYVMNTNGQSAKLQSDGTNLYVV